MYVITIYIYYYYCVSNIYSIIYACTDMGKFYVIDANVNYYNL